MVRLVEIVGNILDEDDMSTMSKLILLLGTGPTIVKSTIPHIPGALKKALQSKTFYRGIAPGVASYVITNETEQAAQEAGWDAGVATDVSHLTRLEVGADAARRMGDRGATGLIKPLTDAGRSVASAGLQAAKTIGSAVAKPSRPAVLKAAAAIPLNAVKAGGGLTKHGVKAIKSLKHIGPGIVFEAVGTALGGAVLEGLAASGALSELLDIPQEDVERHVRDFTTTEIAGVTVPNVDPVSSVIKAGGAIEDLHDVNVERGVHEEGVLGSAEFVYDEVSDHVSESLGGGWAADATGAVVGGTAGAITAVGGGIASGGKKVLEWIF